MPVNKAELIAAACAELTRRCEAMRESARQTRAGAVHEESRPENDKDTRGLEASYLARGQAARVEELEEAMTQLRFLILRPFGSDDPIELSALVTLEVDGATQHYFVVPAGGGLTVHVEGVEVRLVTPSSPLGRALIEKVAGDAFELASRAGRREYEIVHVA